MCALIDDLVLHSRESVENDGAGAAFDIVN